jgi:uncharacterized protein (TIGR02246 family)
MNRPALLTATLTALAASACAGPPDTPTSAGWEALEEGQRGFVAAVASRDAEAVASFFAEDGIMHVAGMPSVEGREAVLRFYDNLFNFLTASRMEPGDLQLSRGGDMAYVFGATTNAFQGPDGPVEYAGKYVLVWREIGGEWRIAVYAVSSDASQPGG